MAVKELKYFGRRFVARPRIVVSIHNLEMYMLRSHSSKGLVSSTAMDDEKLRCAKEAWKANFSWLRRETSPQVVIEWFCVHELEQVDLVIPFW